MLEFAYVECECGRRFEGDEDAAQIAAYAHFAACPVAFEKAPQLIVEMAKTLRARGLDLPKAEGTSQTPGIIPSQGKGGKRG